MTELDLGVAIDEALWTVHEIGDDIDRFTQAESAEFYEAVARDAQGCGDGDPL